MATAPMPNDTMELLQTNLPSMAVPGVIGSMRSWAARLGWPMVHEALRQGIGAKGRRTSWSYVEGILKRWTAEGIKSLAELEAAAARDSPGRPGGGTKQRGGLSHGTRGGAAPPGGYDDGEYGVIFDK